MRGESPSNLSPWVVRHARRWQPGQTVLDLACGDGRHARFLADRGLQVTAIDIDIEQAAALVTCPGIQLEAGDLEREPWPYAQRSFDGIVVTRYLHRPLLPLLADTLKAEGLLVYDTFCVGHERYGRPRNPDYLLHPAELLRVYAGELKVLAYDEGYCAKPRPSMRQRLCARRMK